MGGSSGGFFRVSSGLVRAVRPYRTPAPAVVEEEEEEETGGGAMAAAPPPPIVLVAMLVESLDDDNEVTPNNRFLGEGEKG